MSSQRGNCAKSGAQKHQNTTAYRNDLHRKKDKTMKILNSLKITGCCKRCKEVIEWKIKYNKYKPLTRPKKCVKCLQKSVTNSYFIICQSCIESHNVCGKCTSTPPTELSAENTDTVGSELNAKSSISASKIKPEEKEDDDDSDYDEDDSDLDNNVEKVLTITDKAEVFIKQNRAEKKTGAKSKSVDMPRASDKPKVTFEASESEHDSESKHDSQDERDASDGDDENEDDETAFCVNDKKYEDKDKLNEGKDKLDEGRNKLVDGKDRLNDGEDKLDEDKAVDRNKLSTNVKKVEDIYEENGEDKEDGEEEEDGEDDNSDEDDS